MRNILLLFLLLATFNLNAQMNLLSITPTDGSTSVPLNITITVEFDQPIDTLRGFSPFTDFFTNVFDLQALWYSEDLKTVNLGGNLVADKNYYFLVQSTFSQSGETLANPTVVYFTTASELTGSTVSGKVNAGTSSGLDLNNTLVALSSTSFEGDEPMIEIGTFTNSNGDYSIPNVNDGDYYPIAANDANKDGELDPSSGDAFAFLDLITVSGNYAGLDFNLSIPDPLDLHTAFSNADSLRQQLLPVNAELKRISTWKTDSLGNASEWEFYFLTDTVNKVSRLRIDQFGYNLENRYDEWEYQSLVKMNFLPTINNSVDLSIFMENAEAAGGFEFRTQDKPVNLEFSLELILADHRFSHLSYQNPDTSQHIMWAAVYSWYEQIGDDEWQIESEQVYFGDFETGSLIITGVENKKSEVPSHYSLEQNYPNPFNPNTTINYSIPSVESGHISTVKLIIYDVLGNEITTLVNKDQAAGNYKTSFDASSYPSGTYFYQIKTDNYTNTKKMLLLK
jgi:Secretion system C-terminal sorting domain/Bacterial Ig-like domain